MTHGVGLILLVLRSALGLFFLYSGGEKLLRLDDFTNDVANYQIVFPPLDAYLAYLIPWLEVIAGLAVIVGRWGTFGGLVLIAGLNITFINALAIAWAKGLNINCGCFSSSEDPTNYPLHILFNLLLLALALALIPLSKPRGPHRFRPQKLTLPN